MDENRFRPASASPFFSNLVTIVTVVLMIHYQWFSKRRRRSTTKTTNQTTTHNTTDHSVFEPRVTKRNREAYTVAKTIRDDWYTQYVADHNPNPNQE